MKTNEKWEKILKDFRICALDFNSLPDVAKDSGVNYQTIKTVFNKGQRPNFFNQTKIESWVNKRTLNKVKE